METQLWIPTLFAVIAAVYGTLLVFGMLKGEGLRQPAQKTRLRIALIFAAVSVFLAFYL